MLNSSPWEPGDVNNMDKPAPLCSHSSSAHTHRWMFITHPYTLIHTHTHTQCMYIFINRVPSALFPWHNIPPFAIIFLWTPTTLPPFFLFVCLFCFVAYIYIYIYVTLGFLHKIMPHNFPTHMGCIEMTKGVRGECKKGEHGHAPAIGWCCARVRGDRTPSPTPTPTSSLIDSFHVLSPCPCYHAPSRRHHPLFL